MRTCYKKNTIAIQLCLLIPLLFTGVAGAQQFSDKVYQIDKVQIASNRKDHYSEDQKSITIDSLAIANKQSNNLDELLSAATPLYIKSYGSRGALAVPNLRGTMGSHTSVTWNGFPINTPTLGQNDLSQTPLEFVDRVHITHSAAGSLYGNGTFGGAIGLSNEANWNHGRTLSLATEIGSWNNKRYSLQSELGNHKLRYNISGFFQHAQNNFEFHDTQQFSNPLEERKNNAVKNYGVLQNVYFKLSPRNKFEAGLWYQKREKEIPEIMGVTDAGTANQTDSLFRIYGQWHRIFDQSALQFKTGYFYQHQLYTEKENPADNTYMIYSPIETQKWMNDLNYRYYLTNRVNFDIGGQYSRIHGKVNAYRKNIKEYKASIIGAMKYQYHRLTANLSVRQQFNKYTNPEPQFGIGGIYNLSPDKVSIRGHFSTKYRIPTLNDKYWYPGGNKDIKPERGWSGEIGVNYTPNITAPIQHLQSEITAYTSHIHDLIQWIPKAGESYWHVINSAQARSTGIEASAELTLKWFGFQTDIKTFYNYTRAMNLNHKNPGAYKKQLRYTPYHTLKNALSIRWEDFSAGASIHHIGSRYATSDNSRELEPYTITDGYIKKQVKWNTFDAQLKFSVQNIFNKTYQVIAYHPMPGRAYYINLNIQLNKLIN